MMNINVPNLINAAFPDRDTNNRNATILSENSSGGGPNHNEQGFLSDAFPRNARKLFVTAETDDFDTSFLRALRHEGFTVQYFGLGNDDDEGYRRRLSSLKDVAGLGPCETFAVIAFGEAASLCLEYWHRGDNNPEFKLAGLVAYYPSRIPDPRGAFPGGVRVVAHLVGDEVGVVGHSQMVGIQGKRRVVKRAVAGVGVGGAVVAGHAVNYPCYRYRDAGVGFAEEDLDDYDPLAAELAWSRSLDTLRTAFRMDVELEGVVERNLDGKFYSRNLGQTMSTYTTHKPPHATYFPTLTGGINAQELRRFYADYFLTTNPSSTKLTLVSRTAGTDRVVDELHLSFKHTQEMPWILPSIPPTDRRVEMVVISIVTLRGGKLYHEHVYWDQASVLVQVGLLDPKVVPEKARAKGVRRLPVVGREAARRLVRGFEDDDDVDEGEADNELLPGWYDDDDDDDDDDEDEGVGDRGKEGKGGSNEPRIINGQGGDGKDKKEKRGASEETQKRNGEENGGKEKKSASDDEVQKMNGEEDEGRDGKAPGVVEGQEEPSEPKDEKESLPSTQISARDSEQRNEGKEGPPNDTNGVTTEETS
ncbi:hypothetical protein F4803DRAFT_554851 [Xylaria telfairii]|nr:hypothetical protein F4803DRAFT_554851 [Xylaria telfairii]